MDKRIARMEAIEAVRLVKTRYWTMVDAVDLDGVRSCFTDDAVIEMEGVPSCGGPDDYLEYLRAHHRSDGGRSIGLHTGQNPRIEIVGGDKATATWDQLFLGKSPGEDGGTNLLRLTGVYEDEYRCLSGSWRISAMRFRQTSFLMMPLPEGGIFARSSADFFGS